MAANTDPIFSRLGDIGLAGGVAIGSATTGVTTDYTGITATVNVLVYTADATNGSFVQRLRFKAMGTNALSVARVFINNGSTVGTAGNNSFIGEINLPATTASTTVSTPDIDYPMNFALPPGYKIYLGISAASNLASGWAVTAFCGKY